MLINMDSEAIFSHVSLILKKYWLAISLGLFGLTFFIYGLISLFGSASNQDIKFSHENLASDSTTQAIKTSKVFTVDIEGAVAKPGDGKSSFEVCYCGSRCGYRYRGGAHDSHVCISAHRYCPFLH